MNKRQAKKKFKKEYGCNPDEFCCTLDICLKNMSKVCDEICEAMPIILEQIAESLNTLNQFLASDGFYHIRQALSEMDLERENKENKKMSNIEKLLELVKENPDLPIVPMVDGEIAAEECGYWMGKWGLCKIDEYYLGEEKVHFKGDEEEDVLCDMVGCHYGCDKNGKDIYELSDEEWDELYQNLPWVKNIIVYIDMPD